LNSRDLEGARSLGVAESDEIISIRQLTRRPPGGMPLLYL
jgi:hypothetical protein